MTSANGATSASPMVDLANFKEIKMANKSEQLNFEHVMVDLETLGRRAGCAILSIGAVAFDPGTKQLGPKFYTVIHRPSNYPFGLHEDPETLGWWSKQSGQAQQVLHDSMTTAKSQPLSVALVAFNAFMEQFGKGKVKLWGNGADFDNAILVNCFANTNIEPCWKFWNHRCYRTLKSFTKTKPARLGTYHNALDDAITQAVHAVEIWR